MKLPDRRYLVWAVGLAATAALPLFAGFTRVGWEFSEFLGLAGTLACLALCGCPVRPRDSRPPVVLSPDRHALLGWIALAAAALHILSSIAADRNVVQYLLPTAPLYQLAGIGAFVVLLLLVASSAAGARRGLWRSHRGFQAAHVALACILLALLAGHVIAAGRYTGGLGRRIAFVAVAAGGIAMLLRRRYGAAAAATPGWRRFAFGRHSPLVIGVIAVTVMALCGLVLGRAGAALREPLSARATALPLDFDHGKHVAVNCLVCHHNYADGRGFDACVHCHRSTRADLTMGAEATFHGFCLDCHRHPAPRFTRHGPVSGCEVCHPASARPR